MWLTPSKSTLIKNPPPPGSCPATNEAPPATKGTSEMISESSETVSEPSEMVLEFPETSLGSPKTILGDSEMASEAPESPRELGLTLKAVGNREKEVVYSFPTSNEQKTTFP